VDSHFLAIAAREIKAYDEERVAAGIKPPPDEVQSFMDRKRRRILRKMWSSSYERFHAEIQAEKEQENRRVRLLRPNM